MTIIFWLVIIGMAMLSIAILFLPILANKHKIESSHDELNASLFENRLEELTKECDGLSEDDENYQSLKSELKRSLLEDIPASNDMENTSFETTATSRKKYFWLFFPIIAIVFYGLIGYQGKVQHWFQINQDFKSIVHNFIDGKIEFPEEIKKDLPGFMAVMQAELEQIPAHSKGWHILGVMYLHLEQVSDATYALKMANSLNPGQHQIMFDLAQALISNDNGNLSPYSKSLLQKIINQDHKNERALSLYGISSYNSGDFHESVQAFKHLLLLTEKDSKKASIIKRTIANAEAKIKQSKQIVSKTVPTKDNVSIKLSIDIKQSLREKIKPNDTIFVFAKAINGSRIPLAAVKQTVTTFPITVVLNDSTSMSPQFVLSSVDQVSVSARISSSGNAMAQSGDLQGSLQNVEVKNGEQSYQLLIESVVP
ncbi:MAG: c-type cytochrome biogenesis protein CcmI [Methylococcales bacterium]|jgi:cytochrome c-type biogenesis protein CcmH|nr:c-type cytochrome biogenesis protein CcmI [Methylococcales bacterium]MBT7408628.1 c-type cytochrome biogenesis protein CcmI [Methylococcales bacterium]